MAGAHLVRSGRRRLGGYRIQRQGVGLLHEPDELGSTRCQAVTLGASYQ